MTKIFTTCLAIFMVTVIAAQELNIQVSVSTPKLQTADPKVFETLEASLIDFLANQKWTNDIFETEERINCNFQLTIKEELSSTSFKADLAVNATRPVYGSVYETPLINYVDKDVQFEYEQNQPLEYSINSYKNNLTSVFTFYTYFILGMDYDSYSPLGGEKYFKIADEIINAIPQSEQNRYRGWRSTDGDRNRYWMVENVFNPRVRPLREAYYKYHRHGLDLMESEPNIGKQNMLAAIKILQEVERNYINAMIVQMFADAKQSEIIEVFKVASTTQKNQVHKLMTKVDPSHASNYRKILR